MNLFKILKGILFHPLNRKTRISSVLNFFKWQIGSRLVSGPVVIDFVNDSKILVDRGMTGATGNLYSGLHEFEDMGFLLHFLRPDDLFVDIGANIGSYTILASSAIGAKTIAFEPVPSTFRWLKKNVLLNGVHELVQLFEMGVGRKSGNLIFTTNQDTKNHVVMEKLTNQIDRQVTVDVVTLDESINCTGTTLIKIDVEGFEQEVLAGGNRVFSSPETTAVIMEVNSSGVRYGYSDEDLLKTMNKFGFDSYGYCPFSRKLTPLHGIDSSLGNTLFIKDLIKVEKRVFEALPFKVKDQKI